MSSGACCAGAVDAGVGVGVGVGAGVGEESAGPGPGVGLGVGGAEVDGVAVIWLEGAPVPAALTARMRTL